MVTVSSRVRIASGARRSIQLLVSFSNEARYLDSIMLVGRGFDRPIVFMLSREIGALKA